MELGLASTPVSMPITATTVTPLKAPNEPGSTAQLKGPLAPDSSSTAVEVDESSDVRQSHTASITMAPRHVTIELATTAEELAALKPEYDRLHAACGNILPFALHEWHLSWWEHMARTEGKVRDRLRVYVVRDELGHCVAIVPFVSTRRELGYFSTESLRLLGADPNITELRSPLVIQGAEALVAEAVTQRLAADGGWDWVQWSGVQGRLGEALRAATPITQHPPILDYVIDLAPTWDAFRAGLKRNIRESLRHCYNSVKRDGLTMELEVAETPDAVRNALHVFLSLHAMRAGLAKTVTHPDRFATDAARRFLYDVCDRLAARGAARIFILKIRGCAVAARVAFVVGDQMYLYYSGFDPRWAKYSVSTTIVAEAIKYAISSGLTAANLSTGVDVSKTRWGARLVRYEEMFQIRDGVFPRLTYAAYREFMDPENEWLAPLKRRLPKHAWG
jgi:CelD/BcsL family acetyltransferase involved in cellulose biosynthesis